MDEFRLGEAVRLQTSECHLLPFVRLHVSCCYRCRAMPVCNVFSSCRHPILLVFLSIDRQQYYSSAISTI